MKREPKNHPRDKMHLSQTPSASSELAGLLDLGMKRDALQLARRTLKNSAITAETFNEALSAILTLADKLKPWKPLVESAHRRLSKRERRAARCMMMSFHNACLDHEGVLQLLPKKYSGELSAMELSCVMEATFALGNRQLMKKLARRLPDVIHKAEHPFMQARLLLCWAEFLSRQGEWAKAIAVLEPVQFNETHCRNAVIGIVEIHTARALLALRQGFELIEQFDRNFDPDTEIMLPGNNKAVLEQAAKEFRRLQRIFEKVVGAKRRKELGLCLE